MILWRVYHRQESSAHLPVCYISLSLVQIMICPLMQAVTYIDEHKNFRTYKLDLLAQYNCSNGLLCRLKYAKTMVERIMQMKSASASSVKSANGSTGQAAVAAH